MKNKTVFCKFPTFFLLVQFFRLLAAAGCVDVPINTGAPQDTKSAVRLVSVRLEPGAKQYESLHFIVRAYSSEKAEYFGRLAEKNYESIMAETNLYSFMPSAPYEIICFSDKAEYHSKTGQPDWSGGVTIGNAIAVYDSGGVESILAHEMTHVIFNEFMGRSMPALRWLNEGIAVYMETKTFSSAQLEQYRSAMQNTLKTSHMPFSRMIDFVPASEETRLVNAWYLQSEDVVSFMLEKGGKLGFSIFLSKLKDGLDMDNAIRQAYPVNWQTFAQLEKDWLAHLGV